MKKLRLNPDELVVESFGLPENHSPTGTVHGQSGFDYCTDWSARGGDTCGPCGETETCTYDPAAFECGSYAAQCPLTENNGWTCGGSGCTQAPDYTCTIYC